MSRGQKVTDHIIFAVPGTLLDWILRNRALDPKKIKMLVLDEADVMIAQQGYQDQVIRIHKYGYFPFVILMDETRKKSLTRPFIEIINNHSYWEIFCWPTHDRLGHMHLSYFHRGLPSGLL